MAVSGTPVVFSESKIEKAASSSSHVINENRKHRKNFQIAIFLLISQNFSQKKGSD